MIFLSIKCDVCFVKVSRIHCHSQCCTIDKYNFPLKGMALKEKSEIHKK